MTAPAADHTVEARVEADARRAEALLKTGALQSAIFNSVNFSSIATDANGVIQIFNVGAERMLGYAAVDVMNRVTPAHLSDPQEVVARATELSLEFATPIAPGFEALVFKASRGIEDIYELTYIRKDGSRFPAVVSVTALRDVNGAVIGYLLIGTDNTARKQVEEERAKLEQKLRDQHFYTRSLIESNIDALMTTDPRGIITDVNKQAEALTGCTRDELIGAPFKNYFTDSERAQTGINRVLREGRITNYELIARDRNGKLTVVSYNATTFHDRDRQLQGVFAAARDVTELKRFEQTLQEANRLKSEFLANMSHELRTPLNAIIDFAELIFKGKVGAVSADHKEYLGDILNSSRHLLQLINHVLDLAKVESGKMEFLPEPISLAKIVGEVSDILRGFASTRRIRIETQVDPAIGAAMLDAAKLKQVLYNYLSNALKFTPEEGRVTVRIQPATPGRFRIEVEDTGIGIRSEEMHRLFVEFQQLDAGTSKKYPGTGLGLALTKRIVEAQGGEVGVRSEPGRGSVFWCVLPMSTPGFASPPVARAPSPARVAAAGRKSVLVVDDDPGALRLMDATLRQLGYAVTCIAAPGDALIALTNRIPDAVVMDVLIPHINGFALLDCIRANPRLRDVPVIVWTVKDLTEAERRRLLEHAQGIVQKSQGGTDAIVAALAPYLSAAGADGVSDGR